MVKRELLISIEYLNILTRNLEANLIIDSTKNEQIIFAVKSSHYKYVKETFARYTSSFKQLSELGIEDEIISNSRDTFLWH